MALRIQHNIAALNAHRNLTLTDFNLSKSMERLSTGYRINRAADDAVGLAISEGFRQDIASFRVASRNAAEASSLLQVAEGAADQISSMLVRLKELATQAASANAGSNIEKIEEEKGKLLTEIDKIANSTEYAGSALVNGSYGVTGTTGAELITANGYESMTGMKGSYSYVLSVDDANTTYGTVDFTAIVYNNNGDKVGEQTLHNVKVTEGSSKSMVSFGELGVDVKVNNAILTNGTNIDGDSGSMVTAGASTAQTFQVGARDSTSNQIDISLGDMTQAGLGIDSIDLSTASGAQSALTTIENAMSSLNSLRSTIGAQMNQLEYHAANLATTIENVTASESIIRDVDMAAEMTTFTKNQILLQAGSAMLAQANLAPQVVLGLLG